MAEDLEAGRVSPDEKESLVKVPGAVVTFQDIKYSVKVSPAHKCCACCRPVTKDILKGVSGVFKPGINAIMGPTGGGKTSLLDTLAARKDPQGLSGTILIDGKPQPANFKCMSGYVSQDDHVMGTLTVKENLLFSANLRLPSSTTVSDRMQRVDETIQELGLTECQNTKIGNDFIRGVSGGERKRTNIGMELIISPSVLYLDEPTTGLDASTANAVITLLHRLGRKGRTIIFSIHQPRYSIFRLFDRLSLLSLGNMVFHGPASEALDYFSSIGYECEPHNNPPDFFLDVLNGESSAVKATRDDEMNELTAPVLRKAGSEQILNLSQHLLDKFQKSVWYSRMRAELDPVLAEFSQKASSGRMAPPQVIEYASTPLRQLRYVTQRAVKNLVRNPQATVLQMFIMIVFALLVGIIYFDIDDSASYGIQNRSGAIFFVVMNQIFGTMTSLELFIAERKIFVHENANGFYRVSVYFLSKVTCDIIPLRLLPVIVFSCVCYWMVGFRDGADHFLIFLFSLYMVCLASASLGFLFSSIAPVTAIANVFTAMSSIVMMIFGGLLVNIDSLGDWLSWLQYISFFRYGMNALSINEFKDRTFCDPPRLPGLNETCITGNDYLVSQGIPYEDTIDLWINHLAMGAMFVGFMVLTYIRLRFLSKYS